MKLLPWLGLLLLSSCSFWEKPFTWSPEVEKLTDKDIHAWIRKVPFSNEWNPKEGAGYDTYVITNEQEVFPFLGGFQSAESDYPSKLRAGHDAHERELVIYKDPYWGESFVFASLLYDPVELFVHRYYSEGVNSFTSGDFMTMDRRGASLLETKIVASHADYKTGVYWVKADQGFLLMLFYQQDALVFQAAFPCDTTQKEQALAQLLAIHDQLGLNIPEWKNASVADLRVNQQPISFWQNPYVSLFPTIGLPLVEAKLKFTSYQEMSSVRAREAQATYLYEYENEYGLHQLAFWIEKVELDRQAYEAKQTGMDTLHLRYMDQTLLLDKEQELEGQIKNQVQSYLKDGMVMHLRYQYPEADPQARAETEQILRSLKPKQY